MLYDDARNILELRWFAETEFMNDNDYMRWLERYAASAEQYHVPFTLIDTRAFHHHPGAHTGPWREEHIIPQYNRAGVSIRSEEHTSELQSHLNLVCRLLLQKTKKRHSSRDQVLL